MHIVNTENQLSPSSFIPYCEFGGETSAVGVKIDKFDFPICKSFQAKVLNDQLCYEVDLNRVSNKDNIEREMQLGFNFIMDYNEDRQVTFNFDNDRSGTMGEKSFAIEILESDNNHHASIYLNTVGRFQFLLLKQSISQNLQNQ